MKQTRNHAVFCIFSFEYYSETIKKERKIFCIFLLHLQENYFDSTYVIQLTELEPHTLAETAALFEKYVIQLN